MHSLTETHGWAYYREFFPGDFFRSWQAAEATALFLDHVFGRYPLRKLYSELPAHDEGPIQKLKEAGFQEEMRLKDDVWHGASYVDYVYLGLFREEWNQRRVAYLAELATRDVGAGRAMDEAIP